MIFVKNNNFKFVWFNDNKIFIRKNENRKYYIVLDENDLSKLQ